MMFEKTQRARWAVVMVLMAAVYAGCVHAAPVEPRWVHAMPDQSDSQQVDVNSAVYENGEWLAWLRSDFIVPAHLPAEAVIPQQGVKEIRMAARCDADEIHIRAMAVRLRQADGTVVYELADPAQLSQTMPPMSVDYHESVPRLVCAAGVAQHSGQPLHWPASAQEVRDALHLKP